MRARTINDRSIPSILIHLVGSAGLAWTTSACASAPVKATPPAESEQQAKEDQRQPMPDQDKPVAPRTVNPLSGGSVRDAEKDILAKWDSVRAFSARIKIEMGTGHMVLKPGGDWEPQMHVRGEGTYELLKQDHEARIRVELTGQSHIHKGLDDTEPRTSKLTRLYDGEFLYSVGKEGGETFASKAKLVDDDFVRLGGEDFLKRLHKEFRLKRRPDETVGARAAFVIEGKPKNGEGWTIHWFDKDTGILIKMSVFDKSGNLRNRLTLDDIKLDPQFHEKRFIFIPPQGVEIKDLTAQQG